MKDTFPRALALVLAQEGGYADHPYDPGGATNFGITIATLRDWRGRPVSKADVRALGRDEVAAIYRARYWNVTARATGTRYGATNCRRGSISRCSTSP